MAAPGSSQAPVSFGFTRSVKQKLLVLGHKDKKEEDDKEYVVGAEGKALLGVNPVPVDKPLVIPLIRKNRWAHLNKTKEKSENVGPQEELDPMLSQAVQELIAESRNAEQNDPADETLSIPILLQNRVPGGYEDGDTVNVGLRPESAEAADYESVPVEHYGMAMLRGMGWKEGEGIGKTFKQDVKPIEQKLRPKGLGLGADRTALKELEPQKSRRPLKPGEEPEEESKGLGTGSTVFIQSGAHKELYGKVEGIDADNCRAVVKLAIGGNVVTVSQFALRLVNSSEYKKYAKDLSRLSKAEQAKEQGEAKGEKRNELSPDRERRGRAGEDAREQSRNSDSSRDKRHRPRSPERERDRKKSKQDEQSWLHRDLRVRFIDKHYKGGKYYNSKMQIEDVLSPTSCVCRTESGRILEDIKQNMLETVIPKEEGDYVMVVLGKHRRQVGKILHRDRQKSRALVQLYGEHDNAVTFSYDVICHYTGERED